MIPAEILSINARKIDIPVKEIKYPKIDRKAIYDGLKS